KKLIKETIQKIVLFSSWVRKFKVYNVRPYIYSQRKDYYLKRLDFTINYQPKHEVIFRNIKCEIKPDVKEIAFSPKNIIYWMFGILYDRYLNNCSVKTRTVRDFKFY